MWLGLNAPSLILFYKRKFKCGGNREMSEKEQYLESLPIADKIERKRALTKEDVLSEEGLLLIQCLARDGAKKSEIAEILGVTKKTLWKWGEEHPEVKNALLLGKDLVDYKVENALLKAAVGYTKRKTITYIGVTKNSKNKSIGGEEIIEEVGPSVTACLAWLNNRKPDKWRRNRDNETTPDENKTGITINIVKGNENIKVEEEYDDND